MLLNFNLPVCCTLFCVLTCVFGMGVVIVAYVGVCVDGFSVLPVSFIVFLRVDKDTNSSSLADDEHSMTYGLKHFLRCAAVQFLAVGGWTRT